MKCSLCGLEFDERKTQLACQKCGWSKNCDLVRCPNCFFENVRETRPSIPPPPSDGCIPLSNLKVNGRGTVTYLRTRGKELEQKIIALGVLPSSEVALVQKFPSFVFQIGRSQFAIDRELASSIYVKPI